MIQRLAALFRRATPAAVVLDVPPATPAPQPTVPGWYWLQHPMVWERASELISGRPETDAYGRMAVFLDENDIPRPLARCVVLGCGSGNLERDLTQRGMVGRVDGYDGSDDAIAGARRLAAEHGHTTLKYHVGDLALEGTVDAVFTHGAIQRVEGLEALFARVHRALTPDGLFHLNEFVGPSRFQWTDLQLELINGFLATLPGRLTQTPRGPKAPMERPTVAHMVATNPTQAARSAEMRDVLAQQFDIVEERPFGGTLLHMGLDGIAQNFDPAEPEDRSHLQRFFDLEDRMIRSGAIGSDFTVLTARPRGHGRRLPRIVGGPAAFGAQPTRQLRCPPAFAMPGVDLTVSEADTMLADDTHYLAVGQSALALVERALGDKEPRSILDLPCGFGRVTRALRARFPHAAITVSDLDRPGVDFSARQFDARGAYSVRDFRTLDLDERFDLIWVGSLMTHLPAETTKQLFHALARHLAAGGTALITLQGPSIIPRLRETGYGLPKGAAERVIAEFEQTGFGYGDYAGGEEALYGVSLTNDNYGISLTDRPWMEAALEACGLRLDAYEIRGWDDHHDVVTARLAGA